MAAKAFVPDGPDEHPDKHPQFQDQIDKGGHGQASQGGAEAIVVQGGNLVVRGNGRVGIAEEWSGIEGLVLQVLIELTVEPVGA